MFKKLFSLFLLCFLLVPVFASADGGLVPPPGRMVFETDQKAVIFHEDGVEDLILSVGFKGDAEDFGWIVPTPERPEVSKASEELFTSLKELTRVKRDYMRPAQSGFKADNTAEQSVEVVETKKVEYYDISVLKASDSDALAEWLDENEYRFPEEAGYVLDDYIKNNWYFTAVKIDTESVTNALSSQLRSGHMIPLRLTFDSEKIVYPLKISSVMQHTKNRRVEPAQDEETGPEYYPRPQNSTIERVSYYPSRVGVLLYVFTPENKQNLPGFDRPYAGWVKKDTIEKMAYDDQGEPWIEPNRDKYFLTKMYQPMSYSQMTHDLYPRDASDNKLINAEPLDDDKDESEKDMLWFWMVMVVSGGVLLGSFIGFIYLSRN